MTPEEQQEWEDYKQHQDAQAHQRLCERYLPQVKRIVNRMEIYLGDGVLDREDLYQAGIIGLIHALEKFDPGREIEFLSFAQQRIRGAVYDELRSLDEFSNRSRRQKKALNQTREKLQTQLQRPPTDEEAATEMGVSLKRFRSLQAALDIGKAVAHSEEEQEALLAAPQTGGWLRRWQPGADGLSPAEKFQILAGKIDELPERARIVLGLYYRDGLTLKEIADVMQLTESRICQIHAQAIELLQQQLDMIGAVFVSR